MNVLKLDKSMNVNTDLVLADIPRSEQELSVQV